VQSSTLTALYYEKAYNLVK